MAESASIGNLKKEILKTAVPITVNSGMTKKEVLTIMGGRVFETAPHLIYSEGFNDGYKAGYKVGYHESFDQANEILLEAAEWLSRKGYSEKELYELFAIDAAKLHSLMAKSKAH